MSNLNYTSKHLFWMMFLLITLTPNITARAQDADVNKKQAPTLQFYFWQDMRTGTNAFNHTMTEAWFEDARALGVSWVRLAYDKWDTQQRDFLLGSADDYKGLVKEDLEHLKTTLDWAHAHGLKVVIAPLSLPGARWSQNNDRKTDVRLWNDKKYWQQAQFFWSDLAEALHGHPAVIAYNIVNEPVPEYRQKTKEHIAVGITRQHKKAYRKNQGSASDLYLFYTQMIATIRRVDPNMPIMVDAGWYAQLGAFTSWPAPLKDDNILYAFHMYEPYAFTSGKNFRDKAGYSYPGVIPFGETKIEWNAATLKQYLDPFYKWAALHNIPNSKLVAGEFGCMRRNKGCRQYLTDIIDIFQSHQTHWAFYAYREDAWDGYDYELGAKELSAKYWQAKERGGSPSLPRYKSPLFDAIRTRINPYIFPMPQGK